MLLPRSDALVAATLSYYCSYISSDRTGQPLCQEGHSSGVFSSPAPSATEVRLGTKQKPCEAAGLDGTYAGGHRLPSHNPQAGATRIACSTYILLAIKTPKEIPASSSMQKANRPGSGHSGTHPTPDARCSQCHAASSLGAPQLFCWASAPCSQWICLEDFDGLVAAVAGLSRLGQTAPLGLLAHGQTVGLASFVDVCGQGCFWCVYYYFSPFITALLVSC